MGSQGAQLPSQKGRGLTLKPRLRSDKGGDVSKHEADPDLFPGAGPEERRMECGHCLSSGVCCGRNCHGW